ncbi:MAG: CvpA family protein [Bacteroidetes bacterium]|nr:MAG: CvpA family protein [Bacteroidota bacterium]
MVWAAWNGFRKGLIIEVFTLLALLVGIYAGIRFSDMLSERLVGEVRLEPSYLPVVSFLILFLGVGAAVYFAGKALEKLVKIAQLSVFNKLAGAVFSMLKIAYLISILFLIWHGFSPEESQVKKDSLLYKPFCQLSLYTIPSMKESQFLNQLDSLENIWLFGNEQDSLSPPVINPQIEERE